MTRASSLDTARYFALRRLWAAFGFQRTRPTIRGPGAIEENIAIVDPACRVQKLALRAYIDVPILVEGKVLSAQRAIFVLGFLNDRNVRSDPLLVDDPVERRRRSVRSVRCKTFGLQAEALLGPANHRLHGADLRLANGARGLDVHNHPKLHIDEIVIGVGEKGRSAHRPRPLRGRIRRRDKLLAVSIAARAPSVK